MKIFSNFKNYFRWYVLVLLFIFCIALWSATIAENQTGLTFAALNIGQGDGLFIESPTGVKVLMDGGPDDKKEAVGGGSVPEVTEAAVLTQLDILLPTVDMQVRGALSFGTVGDGSGAGGRPILSSCLQVFTSTIHQHHFGGLSSAARPHSTGRTCCTPHFCLGPSPA